VRNGITDYCKTMRHLTLLFILGFTCTVSLAKGLSINVYLKLKPINQVSSLIKDFNQFLGQQPLFVSYHITPFLKHYPLHNTLYLTDYDRVQIPKIIKQVQAIAKQQKPILLSTNQFTASASGYVMLSIKRSKELQELSNKTLNSLAPLRDKKAIIPSWAAQDSNRSEVFKHYGSPNVLNYFNPHFSIFDPVGLSQIQTANLYEQLQQLISQFSQAHPTQVRAIGYAIGVGLADTQGQIVTELATFKLL